MANSPAIERLSRLKELLKIERDEDFRLYNEMFLRVNLDERRKNGVTWYPIKINSEEIGSGELLHLELERTAFLDKPHQFSSGKNVSLFSNRADEVLAWIHEHPLDSTAWAVLDDERSGAGLVGWPHPDEQRFIVLCVEGVGLDAVRARQLRAALLARVSPA